MRIWRGISQQSSGAWEYSRRWGGRFEANVGATWQFLTSDDPVFKHCTWVLEASKLTEPLYRSLGVKEATETTSYMRLFGRGVFTGLSPGEQFAILNSLRDKRGLLLVDSDFQAFLSRQAVWRGGGETGTRLWRAGDLFDPANELLADLWESRPHRLPADCYKGATWLELLRSFGLQRTLPSAAFLEEMRGVAAVPADGDERNGAERAERSLKLLRCLREFGDTYPKEALAKVAATAFVPVDVNAFAGRPGRAEGGGSYARFSDVAMPKDAELVWTTMPVLLGGNKVVPKSGVRTAVGLAHPPRLENVIAHLLKLTGEVLVDAEMAEQLEREISVPQMLRTLYEHLQGRAKAEKGEQKTPGEEGGAAPAWGELKRSAWLLVDPEKRVFAAPDQVFLSLPEAFRPLLYKLPESLLDFASFFAGLGVRPKPSAKTYASALGVKFAECCGEGRDLTLSPNDLELVVRLLTHFGEEALLEGGEDGRVPTPLLEQICIPDEKLKLATCNELVFCDDSEVRGCIDGSQFRFAHPDISQSLASLLEVPFLSSLVTAELNRAETLGQAVDDEDAKRYSETLTSAEFGEGLLRLLQHESGAKSGGATSAAASAKPSPVTLAQRDRIERLRSFGVVRVKSLLSQFTLRATGADVTKDGRRGSCVADGEARKVFLAEFPPDGTAAEELLAQAVGQFVGVADRLPIVTMFRNPPENIPQALAALGVPSVAPSQPQNPAVFALGGEVLEAHRGMLKSDPEGEYVPGEWVAWIDATCQDQGRGEEEVYKYGKIVRPCDPQSRSRFAAKYDVEVGEGDVRQLYAASLFKFDARFEREGAAGVRHVPEEGHVAMEEGAAKAGHVSDEGHVAMEEGPAAEEEATGAVAFVTLVGSRKEKEKVSAPTGGGEGGPSGVQPGPFSWTTLVAIYLLLKRRLNDEIFIDCEN